MKLQANSFFINCAHEMSIKIFEQIQTNRDENFYGKFHVALKKNKKIYT